MAVVNYGTGWGFAQWRAWRQHSSEESPLLLGPYTPAGSAITIRPQGVLLWRGEFQTPILGRNDSMWQTVRTLMESVDEGVNQMLLPVPADQQTTLLGTTLTVQPIDVRAPVRASRGETRGWIVAWIEAP